MMNTFCLCRVNDFHGVLIVNVTFRCFPFSVAARLTSDELERTLERNQMGRERRKERAKSLILLLSGDGEEKNE